MVDLHAADERVRAAGQDAGLVSADGIDPSASGAALIAGEFATALHGAGPIPPLRP